MKFHYIEIGLEGVKTAVKYLNWIYIKKKPTFRISKKR
jgi:hypothetical protein